MYYRGVDDTGGLNRGSYDDAMWWDNADIR